MFEGARGFGLAMSEAVDWGAAVAGLGAEWTVERITCKGAGDHGRRGCTQ
jgi:hypothetical protein